MALALSQCPGIDQTGKDSSAAIQAAFNLKQPIVWDCQTSMVVGSDQTKTVFVPDGSDVTFTPQGRLSVDNAGFPALCFYNSKGIWRGTQIKYTGALGIVAPTSSAAWTNTTCKSYLVANGINTFAPGCTPTWTGIANTSAVISVRGLSDITFQGGSIYVDSGVAASSFVPTAFAIDPGHMPGPVVSGAPVVVPNINVSGFTLDGVIMGVVGGGGNVQFSNMTRGRYADLQDAAGGNIGGTGYFFAPPHFFYLQGSVANPMKATLKEIVDTAVWCGAGRRSVTSGYINSIKLELANGSSIDGYTSWCVDGGLGVLSNGSTVGGTVKNARFVVDSSIVDVNGKPCCTGGLFYPSNAAYPVSQVDVSIRNVVSGWPVGASGFIPGPVATAVAVCCGS